MAMIMNGSNNGKEDSRDEVDYLVPSSWSAESIKLFDKLNSMTETGAWEKHVQMIRGNEHTRLFHVATKEKMFVHATFINRESKTLLGVCQFGPWTEGGAGLVHGGAIATMHDTMAGNLAHALYGLLVTANLNVNFQKGVPLGQTVALEAAVVDVDRRKVRILSKITSSNKEVVYGDASTLMVMIPHYSRL